MTPVKYTTCCEGGIRHLTSDHITSLAAKAFNDAVEFTSLPPCKQSLEARPFPLDKSFTLHLQKTTASLKVSSDFAL